MCGVRVAIHRPLELSFLRPLWRFSVKEKKKKKRKTKLLAIPGGGRGRLPLLPLPPVGLLPGDARGPRVHARTRTHASELASSTSSAGDRRTTDWGELREGKFKRSKDRFWLVLGLIRTTTAFIGEVYL